MYTLPAVSIAIQWTVHTAAMCTAIHTAGSTRRPCIAHGLRVTMAIGKMQMCGLRIFERVRVKIMELDFQVHPSINRQDLRLLHQPRW